MTVASYRVMKLRYSRMDQLHMNNLSKICTKIWHNYLKSDLNLCNFFLKCWLMEMLQHITWSHTLQDTLTISLNQGQIFLAVFLISYQILKEKKNIYPPWPGTKERKIWQNTGRYFLTIRTKGMRSKHHDKQTTHNVIWNKVDHVTFSLYDKSCTQTEL